jgi:PiT family inorganic phosphate transporter
MGAGIAAAGFSAVNWPTMGAIAASWVISPVLGGLIGAAFLAFIKINIIYRDDKIAAARRWVPVLLAVMAAAFSAYLAMKGLKKIIRLDGFTILTIGALAGIITYFATRPVIRRQSEGMENRNQSVRKLFNIPLICSAALLSFAHGANDVANAVGPLAAVVHAAEAGEVLAKVSIPIWVMMIGAAGISFGLLLFGPKLIRMVGEQITKLNPMRAYCVALSAAVTVIIASWFGLAGFLDAHRGRRRLRRRLLPRMVHVEVAAPARLHGPQVPEPPRRRRKREAAGRKAAPPEEARRRMLVRRAHFTTIVAAWVITVPAAAHPVGDHLHLAGYRFLISLG